ncbi:MAG: fatty acid--CoA ligase [Pseudomonadota bacterium]
MIDAPAPSAYAYPLLIKQLFHMSLSCSPEQEIVSGTSHRYTYRSFFSRVRKLANVLEKLGVTPGQTIAVMDWDCHRYLECFFGVPMFGAVLHTINIRLSPEQILYTINHARDDVILVHSDFVELVESISDRFERPIKLIYLRDDDSATPATYAGEYEQLIHSAYQDYDFTDFDENTRATTFYTTGTTGQPKGVFYSHRQLVLHTLGMVAGLSSVDSDARFHRGDVYMPITPMFHVHAWGFPYAATMLGVKQVYPGRYEPATLLRLIENERVTFSHCVPTILTMLLSAPEAESTDLNGWKVIIGGSALPEGLATTALEKGINVFAAYGMSETCPFVTIADTTGLGVDTSDAGISARTKTGKPTVMVDLRVVDDEMNDVPKDGQSVGELVIRTPWLTQAYLNNPEASDELWRGGYLHTGDIAHWSEDGTVQITDRLKDVIKSGGEWISSLELESIASTCDGVVEVAAIGLADEKWGERPALLVSIGNNDIDTGAMSDSIREAITASVSSGNLPRWAVPDTIHFVESIPKTSVGKVDKKTIRMQLNSE